MVMLAKGNRSKAVTKACQKHGGFYLGSIGGPAAILALNCIKKVEVLEYPELGEFSQSAKFLSITSRFIFSSLISNFRLSDKHS